jgi:uncharacterized protein YidB (DUF937 family)
MGSKDNPFGAAFGAALGKAPEATTEGGAFDLPGVAGGDPAQAAGVMGTMMELLQQKGGLGGLLDTFRQSGLAPQADAWAKGDATQGVSGDQVEQALGSPIIGVIAGKLGLSPEQAKATLAQLLPAITSRMAAQQQLTGEANPELEKALGMFKNILGQG